MTSPVTRRTRPPLDDLIPRVPWDDLEPSFMESWGLPHGRFEPEHLTVYGPTGSGKTHFVAYVLATRAALRRSHIVVVATKRADATLTRLRWPILTTWPPGYGQHQVIFWAKASGISAATRLAQRAKVRALLDALWRPKANIIVYFDELPYIEGMLRLKPEVETFYREGRSHGITLVASMQRPTAVSRLAHSETGWTVAFKPKDADDRRRVAEVFGDRALYTQVLQSLRRDRHEFVIKHELTGNAYISHLPRAAGGAGGARVAPSGVGSGR